MWSKYPNTKKKNCKVDHFDQTNVFFFSKDWLLKGNGWYLYATNIVFVAESVILFVKLSIWGKQGANSVLFSPQGRFSKVNSLSTIYPWLSLSFDHNTLSLSLFPIFSSYISGLSYLWTHPLFYCIHLFVDVYIYPCFFLFVCLFCFLFTFCLFFT